MRKLSIKTILASIIAFVSVSSAYAQTIGIAEKAANLYQVSLGVGIVLALGIIVYGGVRYSMSAGNPSGIKDAKDWISAAFMGLFILFGAFLILNTINPNLTNLESILLATNIEQDASVPILTLLDIIAAGGSLDGFAPICYEQCLDKGGTPLECGPTGANLPSCPDLFCPVTGSNFNYSNSWHNARGTICSTWGSCSGGSCTCTSPLIENKSWTCLTNKNGGCSERLHKGIDLFDNDNEPGTPLVAIEAGIIGPNFGYNDLGGYRLWITETKSGNDYYYAHLDNYGPGISKKGIKVDQGQVIGYMDTSGYGPEGTKNVIKSDELHFGMKPVGGSWINPYPTLASICSP